jgi:23S rRNA (uracil1939-C5)-methyltransferase
VTERFIIDHIGSQADGVAETAEGLVFIPFTLPGEIVLAERRKDRALLDLVETASTLRVIPPCRHFGTCGGCSIQHLEDGAYRQWKRDKTIQSIRPGPEVPVDDIVPCAPQTRRRASFSVRRLDQRILLGFNRALSADIVDIVECPITVPEIVGNLDRLRALAAIICTTEKPFQLLVTATASGLDIAAFEAGTQSESRRRLATQFVIREGFARLSVDGEIIVEVRKPTVLFGDIAVSPPPGGFLQATAPAEQAMADIVSAHLGRAKRVLDLFSGSGSFALRLARKSEVHAVESDAAALAALDRGFRFAAGLKRVTTERRDLFRRPVTFKELASYDGIVFDPPRAGAEDQCRQIARSDVPLVAAVSCNPATLARDISILEGGGYALKRVIPVDQFLWSAHVEAVALLEKPRKRR